MRQIVNILVVIIPVCIFCTGCKHKSTVSDNQLGFDSLKVIETYYLHDDHKEPNCNLNFSFVYPVTSTDTSLLRPIQSIFVSEFFGDSYANMDPKEAAAAYKNAYLSNYKTLEKEYKEEIEKRGIEDEESDTFQSHYENSSNQILFNKANVLTFIKDFADYTGGAHGSQSVIACVVDLKTGVQIREEDIFYENYQEKIAPLIVQKIMEQNADNGVKDTKDLENIGYFDVNEIIPNGNFIVDDKGITYIYNQYEIAPYVMGLTKVFFPYDEISIYMKKNGLVAKLAGL